MEKIFEKFTCSILQLYRLIQRIKIQEMREYGLNGIHVMCIYYLDENPGGLTASELVRNMFEDKAAVSRALKTLRDKGYIDGEPDKYNAVIKLTASGVEVARYIDDKANKAVVAGSADMTDGERELFYKSLSSIVENLGEYYKRLVKTNRETST